MYTSCAYFLSFIDRYFSRIFIHLSLARCPCTVTPLLRTVAPFNSQTLTFSTRRAMSPGFNVNTASSCVTHTVF